MGKGLLLTFLFIIACLPVFSQEHYRPRFYDIPIVRCIERGSFYYDSLILIDRDLLSEEDLEQIQIIALQPLHDIQVIPNWLIGPLGDTVEFVIYSDEFDFEPDPAGKVTFELVAFDKYGLSDTLLWQHRISEIVNWECNLLVETDKGDAKYISFGEADLATTGDGSDGNDVGLLDQDYCETELPPSPPMGFFGVSWVIPSTQGTVRNIFPPLQPNTSDYYFKVQQGENAESYSVSWNPKELPDQDDSELNPHGSTWYITEWTPGEAKFRYDMKTGKGSSIKDISLTNEDGIYKLTVYRNMAADIIIEKGLPTDVPEEFSDGNEIKVFPNPFNQLLITNYKLRIVGQVSLKMFDLMGREIAVLDYGYKEAGKHEVRFDGSGLAPGVYLLRMVAGGKTLTKCVVVE